MALAHPWPPIDLAKGKFLRLGCVGLALLAIAACRLQAADGNEVTASKLNSSAPDLAFSCVKEADRLPPLPTEADALFRQARSMERRSGPKDFAAIADLYERAGNAGHWKALQNLQLMIYQGLVELPDGPSKAVDINQKLIQLGAPIGYYNMALFLEQGYGVQRDQGAALSYYRKSADLGSPYGQTYVGKLLLWQLKKPDVGVAMLECALSQGHGDAAIELSGFARLDLGDDGKAFGYAQRGVAAGSLKLAERMAHIFENGPSAVSQLKAQTDHERARRYRLVAKEIATNPDAKFPNLDKIVPLPPTPLPAWDGKFHH